MSELTLKRALVKQVEESPEFTSWLLARTKFIGVSVSLKMARCDNPWYQSKKSGRQSETDVLLVFERSDNQIRFALHIEIKTAKDRFQPDQPELYHERASDWLGDSKWGNYEDFEVILVAPRTFYEKNREKSDLFHQYIPSEAIAETIPEFAS
jgi:hypothetical protein